MSEPPKKRTKLLVAENFKRITQHEHILTIPDTYIGSTNTLVRSDYVWQSGSIIYTTIKTPPGLIKIVDEIVSNSADNFLLAFVKKVEPGKIVVDIGPDVISVRNNGPALPVTLHPTENCYVPELIFGNLLTSSHYQQQENHAAGRNGYGAKLTNIFSKEFEVKIQNGTTTYYQRWENNMHVCHAPVIEQQSSGDEDYVQIRFKPDLERFEVPSSSHFSDEFVSIIYRMVYDYSFSIRAPVVINNQEHVPLKAVDYVRSIISESSSQTSWISSEITITSLSQCEFAIIPTLNDQNFPPISFVNGIRTSDGGLHVEWVWRRVISQFQQKWPKMTPTDIRSHLLLVVTVSLQQPSFNTQMKLQLTGPTLRIKSPPATVWNPLLEDQLLQNALLTITSVRSINQIAASEARDAKKKNDVFDKYMSDAAWAGTARASEAILLMVEGTSAAGYAERLISALEGGKNKYGILIHFGKIHNTSGDNIDDSHDMDRSVERLCAMLGTSTHPRYSNVWLLSDQDDDGKHINALEILYFCKYRRNFLLNGNVYIFETPLIRMSNQYFYDIETYRAWRASNSNSKATARYMKGLATSTEADVRWDANHIRLLQVQHDDESDVLLAQFFDKDNVETRRNMVNNALRNGLPPPRPLEATTCKISAYIRRDAMLGAIQMVRRNLPGADGLKVTQRKIVWGLMTRWARGRNPQRGFENYKPLKISQLFGYVSENFGYNHAERLGEQAVIQLGCPLAFVNNYPLAQAHGIYARTTWGLRQPTNSRYLHVSPAKILNYIFSAEDVPLLTKSKQEEIEGEPEVLLPVVPIHLLNGVHGVGFGYQCYIPPYNMKQVIQWFIRRMRKQSLSTPKPFFRNFPGVRIANKISTKVQPETDDDYDENGRWFIHLESNWKITKYTGTATNIISVDIEILSLPPSTLLGDVIEKLKILKTKKVITEYIDNSADENIKIVVRGIIISSKNARPNATAKTSDYPANVEGIAVLLRLSVYHSMQNFNHLTENNEIVEHKSVTSLLEAFYQFRLPYYNKRLEIIRKNAEHKLKQIQMKHLFVEAFLRNEIDLRAPEEDILQKLRDLEIEVGVYRKMSIANLNLEAVQKLNEQKNEILKERDMYLNKTAEDLWIKDLENFDTFISNYK